MKIELRNIKTKMIGCADLFINDAFAGKISLGSSVDADVVFLGDNEIYASADEWCKKNLPKWTMFNGPLFETDLSMHLLDLFEAHLGQTGDA